MAQVAAPQTSTIYTPEPPSKGREEWVRGLDHVLPIDHTHGNWCGPVEKLVELLDSGEVGVEDKDSAFSLRPLMKAAARNHLDAMKVLLERGADVHSTCNCGETALQKAKRKGHWPAVDLLIASGAKDLEVEPVPGRKPPPTRPA